jgi:hypothetical protein
MAYTPSYKTQANNTDWIAKEKRELFCKSVNTIFMSQDPKTQLKPLADLLKLAQQIVDRAFELYPDKNDIKTHTLSDEEKIEANRKFQEHYEAISKADEINKDL